VGGKVVSNTGGQVEYWAQYGLTKAYGSQSAHQTINVAQNTPTTVGVEITGLQRATLYHFRLCAQDSQQHGGPGCGEDRSFTTQSAGCGDVVTSDVRLTGDLFCPQEPGFIVGADGVDIDLAGHEMSGGISVGGGGPLAIDNRGGFDDVTVRNGSIVGFGGAFAGEDASRNRLLDITASAAGVTVTFHGGQDNEIRRGDIFGRGQAIGAVHSDRLVVADTSADSTFFSAVEVSGDGIRLVRNDLAQTNRDTRNASGIEFAGNNGRIAYNHVEGWTEGGIVVSGSDNAIVGNRVLNNPLLFGSQPNQGFGDGILVNAFSAHTLLSANRADGNGDDGIDVRDSTASLGDNTASTNGDFGIDAAAGVTDLGGNTGSGNGNPLQCRNVFCG
jgi:parallel beta-helix repeat protein